MDSGTQSTPFINLTYVKNCIEWHGNEEVSFQLSNFLFFVAFLIPHNASNQISDLLFRLLITTGCSVHVLWIVSIKEHCFFNYIIFFWPIILIINFLHSFHLTYKLSPASLPKKFAKLYNAMFEPIKLNRKEFKVLMQHSLLINLRSGENYLAENESRINEKVGILLEGKLDVRQSDLFLHHIFPNDFIDSVEFKYMEMYENEMDSVRQSEQQTNTRDLKIDRTCSSCRQVLIDMENISSRQATSQATKNKMIDKANKSRNKSHSIRHQKNCALDKMENRSTVRQSSNEINILSIDRRLEEKHPEFNAVNKLSQVTITASENCKLLCWKRDLLVNDTLANNLRLRTIFHNLIGKDVINKLYLVNEEQRSKQQQIIGESQGKQADQFTPILTSAATKLLAHNPLRGDNLLSKFREVNLLNSAPYLPNESLMYLNSFNRNIGMTGSLINQDLIKQSSMPTLNPYLAYYPPYYFNQAMHPMIINPSPHLQNVLDLEKQHQPSEEQF